LVKGPLGKLNDGPVVILGLVVVLVLVLVLGILRDGSCFSAGAGASARVKRAVKQVIRVRAGGRACLQPCACKVIHPRQSACVNNFFGARELRRNGHFVVVSGKGVACFAPLCKHGEGLLLLLMWATHFYGRSP
jgi:hypothetical protein